MLSATDKLKLLLGTLDEARSDWEAGSGGDSVSLMPSMYVKGSYQELERVLGVMRSRSRLLWWHMTQRYRYGHEHWLWVPFERRDKGPYYFTPANSVLRGTSDHNGRRAKVLVYEWNGNVEQHLADHGIVIAQHLMFNGEWWRIDLPPQLLSDQQAC